MPEPSSELFPIPNGPLDSPSAWQARDLKRDTGWRYVISTLEIDELNQAMKATQEAGLEIIEINQHNFPLPTFGDLLRQLRSTVMDGLGFIQISGIPVGSYTKEEAARIFFGVGAHLGSLRSQNAEGHVLGHVVDVGHDYLNDGNLRGYRAGGPLSFHTDSVDLVALFCLRAAREGGDSKIVSAATIHNEMLKRRPDLVAELYRPIHRDRRGEVPEGKNPWWIMPIFQWYQNRLYSHYSDVYVRSVERFTDVPRFTSTQIETFDLIKDIAEDPEIHIVVPFQAGDIQLLNNHMVLHGRFDYRDWNALEKRRYLLRLWICPPNGRPLPPAYTERYGSIEIGNRGGIVCKGTEFKAPLDPT